jgi:hypothetical protein
MNIYKLLFSILIIILLMLYFNYKKENFDSIGYGFNCDQKTCKNKNLNNCLKCHNCSFVVSGFKSQCVPSDQNGNPIDKKIHYVKKYHNDDWSRANVSVNENYDDNTIPVVTL